MSPGWDGHGLARWALERRCADKDSRQGLRLSSVDETYENGLDSGEEKQRNAFEAIRRFWVASRFFAAPASHLSHWPTIWSTNGAWASFWKTFRAWRVLMLSLPWKKPGSAWWPHWSWI